MKSATWFVGGLGGKVSLYFIAFLWTATTNAALIRHWKLDETTLVAQTEGTSGHGPIIDSTGNSSGGRLFGYSLSLSLPVGVIGNAAPSGLGTSYNFNSAPLGPEGVAPEGISGFSGVFTNSLNAVPATGDFSVRAWIRITNQHSPTQGHIFSNNNGTAQVNRTNLAIQNGGMFWFVNGGQFDTDGDLTSNGDLINVQVNTAELNIFDDEWHEVGVNRKGRRFDLFVDGQVVASGTSLSVATANGVSISQAQSWMIGRGRNASNELDAYIADVRVYDEYIPEPSSAILAFVAIACLAGIRRRR